jgi:molybdopterin-guanine dinucleotide biosynthesis protein A
MPETTKCMIAILAGGSSSRMQTDKATIAWEGVPLLEHIAGMASKVNQTVVVGRTRPENWSGPDVEFLLDDVAGSGPIGGIITALKRAPGQPVLLLAVDMPLITEAALIWLANQEIEGDGLAVLNNGQIEPLFSVYSPSALPLLNSAINSGRRSLVRCIEVGNFRKTEIPAEFASALTNVNTREELQKVREDYSGKRDMFGKPKVE